MSLAVVRRIPISRPERRRVAVLSVELTLTCIALLLYFVARGMRPPEIDESVARSLRIIHFEQQLGIFREQAWQSAFISNGTAMWFANLVYAWAHFPVLAAIGVWLLFKDVGRFRFTRNVMLLSGIIGIVCYWALPAAPPRLMEFHGYDFGFVDTVHSATSNAYYLQPGPLVNDYAALPSFHFGWIALASATIWVNTTRRWVRAMAVGLSLVMLWAIIVTANHYFFDIAFGGAVVGMSWLTMAGIYSQPVRGRYVALVERVRSTFPSPQASQPRDI
ncbi:MAG TPA: phosphatase PAP2 family protein [Tepidiformaceae bacterium]|nr:phosphatase PAP2 family protein [Tepidiformaceae bacterium]